MRSIKVKLERSGVTLDGEVLGCAGEKGAVQLEIDVSDIAQEGVDSAFLRYRMPDGVTLEGESAALPDTGPLTVTVPAWAMSERGRVQMQLTLTGADKAVRSYVWSLRVLPSLEVGGTPPEAVRVWLAEVEESIAQALEFCAAVEQVSVTAQTLEAGAPATASGSVSAQEGLRLTLGLPTGAAGPKGDAGAKGEPGAVYTPSVSGEGVLSWSNNGGLPNPRSVNLRGPQGMPGADGKDGTDGKDGANGADGQDGTTPTIGDNGNWYIGDTDTGKPSRGEIGPAGADGKSAYAYAVEGGYTGTEEAFAVKLAADIPAVDSTLTQPGQAADAKTVGDALSNISEELANLQTSGLTTERVNALDGLFKIVAYTADPASAYSAFKVAFGLDGGGTGVTLSSISATYSGGDVAVGTALSALTGIVVTATYSDGSTATVTGYTLSGEIAEGSNTITVTYQGKTATFIVTGTAVAQTYTVTNNLTNVTNSNSATTASGYYSATLSAEDGYNINVNITMGGMDITADVYTEDGTILITEVTGDIVITATAELASSPVIYQLANTPRTVNADLYEDTGLTFGSNSANGYTKAWTMVAKVKNMSAGYLWCVAGQDNLSAKYESRWNGDAENYASHLTTAICASIVRPSITQVNPDEISVVITKEALSEKTATVYYLNYAGELQTSQCVGTYGKFSISVYAGNMMVGGKSSADFVGTIEEFTIYEGVATVEQIKSYLGVA